MTAADLLLPLREHDRSALLLVGLRAIRSDTLALADRRADDRDREPCLTEPRMTDSYLAAFGAWRAEHPPGHQ